MKLSDLPIINFWKAYSDKTSFFPKVYFIKPHGVVVPEVEPEVVEDDEVLLPLVVELVVPVEVLLVVPTGADPIVMLPAVVDSTSFVPGLFL